jgi:hypothetical protein
MRRRRARNNNRHLPARLRFAAFAPFFPSAVRVLLGNLEMVFFFFAARAAFLAFFRAADFCFELAIGNLESGARVTPTMVGASES